MTDDDATDTTTCATPGCDELTPWDMAAIKFLETSFCSPDCARARLSELDSPPTTITLHDPQFAVDRASLPPTVEDDDVTIRRHVTSFDDAHAAIDEIAEMYPGPFRVSAESECR